MIYFPLPDLFFVGSVMVYVVPGLGVGGIGSPLTTVTSFPMPPLDPT